jgi:hypothetical protein
MRRKLGLACGLLVAAGSTAASQFAVDRKPTPPTPAPAPPAGAGLTDLLPYTPTSPTPVTTLPGARPTLPATTPPTPSPPVARVAHPLAVTPQHGEWMICVKSYTGPESMVMAEALTADIRRSHPDVPVYLFEYFAETRAKLEAEQQQVRQAKVEQTTPFLQIWEQEKAKAAKEGRTFVEDGPVKIKVPKLQTPIPDQWAVLVGGFKTPEAARKALDGVHKWKPPADTRLMDKVTAMHGVREGYAQEMSKYRVDDVVDVNPYTTAMCVKNPSLPKSRAEPPADPALWKWNEGETLCVLNCPKPYTLVVKAFTMPVVPLTKDQEPSVMQASAPTVPGTANNAQMMAIFGKQARDMAVMLRQLKDKTGQPRGFEAFVLHIQTGSLVCVGQFDREDDPAMTETVQRLTHFSLNMTSDATGQQPIRPGERSFFDQVSVLKIPRR